MHRLHRLSRLLAQAKGEIGKEESRSEEESHGQEEATYQEAGRFEEEESSQEAGRFEEESSQEEHEKETLGSPQNE